MKWDVELWNGDITTQWDGSYIRVLHDTYIIIYHITACLGSVFGKTKKKNKTQHVTCLTHVDALCPTKSSKNRGTDTSIT